MGIAIIDVALAGVPRDHPLYAKAAGRLLECLIPLEGRDRDQDFIEAAGEVRRMLAYHDAATEYGS